MKNRFKLLKKYPGLPKDWEEGMEVGIGDNNDYFYYPCSINYKRRVVPRIDVENNPEYWWRVQGYRIKYIVPTSGEIYTVIRLSDNEIFSIGDYVKAQGVYGKIIKIGEFEDAILVETTANSGCLSSLTKNKQMAFVSQDKINIFLGDIVFKVGNRHEGVFTALVTKGLKENIHFEKEFLYFAKKENAIKHIKVNKKEFSRKDIIEAINKTAALRQPESYYVSVSGILNKLGIKNEN